jgi:hypothetical protein
MRTTGVKYLLQKKTIGLAGGRLFRTATNTIPVAGKRTSSGPGRMNASFRTGFVISLAAGRCHIGFIVTAMRNKRETMTVVSGSVTRPRQSTWVAPMVVHFFSGTCRFIVHREENNRYVHGFYALFSLQ